MYVAAPRKSAVRKRLKMDSFTRPKLEFSPFFENGKKQQEQCY